MKGSIGTDTARYSPHQLTAFAGYRSPVGVFQLAITEWLARRAVPIGSADFGRTMNLVVWCAVEVVERALARFASWQVGACPCSFHRWIRVSLSSVVG
jgi:hypothetical protein